MSIPLPPPHYLAQQAAWKMQRILPGDDLTPIIDAMHAHAAAVSAAKDARIKVLEGALRKAIVQNEHDMLMTGEELRAARAALGDKT